MTSMTSMKSFADRWTAIGLSTAPIDRAKAGAAVDLAYNLAGLHAPSQFVWCQSPLAMDLAHRMVGGSPLQYELRTSPRGKAHSAVKDAVGSRAINAACDSIRDVVGDPVWNGVHQWVHRHVVNTRSTSVKAATFISDSIWSGVSDSLWEAGLGHEWERGQLSEQDQDWCFGSHDASWLGIYSYFREELRLRSETDGLEGLMDVAQECCWWFPCEDVVFISSKPHKIDTGSVSFSDGMEVDRSRWSGLKKI